MASGHGFSTLQTGWLSMASTRSIRSINAVWPRHSLSQQSGMEYLKRETRSSKGIQLGLRPKSAVYIHAGAQFAFELFVRKLENWASFIRRSGEFFVLFGNSILGRGSVF